MTFYSILYFVITFLLSKKEGMRIIFSSKIYIQLLVTLYFKVIIILSLWLGLGLGFGLGLLACYYA